MFISIMLDYQWILLSMINIGSQTSPVWKRWRKRIVGQAKYCLIVTTTKLVEMVKTYALWPKLEKSFPNNYFI